LLNNYLSISRNSPEISQNLQQWLAWDLTSQEWKNIDSNTGRFNPIRTFFGESLPTDIYFASKAGWTSNSRQEVAFVRTRDGKTAYILAAFAEDAAYAKNSQIFPQISRQVFERMNR
jgi:beta-lactamase class A